jgi:putative inorganic carbon (HCO3(-)) transporter
VGRGRLTLQTRVGWAVFSLLIMVPVTLWATALPDVTLPAVYQLLAGVAVFYSIVNWASSERRVWWATLGLVALGLALALIAPVSVQWMPPGKLFALPQIYGRFPLLLKDPINANVMAGALALIMPMALALALPGWGRKRAGARSYLLAMAMGLSFLLMAFILFLTKSRGAYIAVVITLLLIPVLRSRWFLVGLPLGLAGLAVAWWRQGTRALADLLMTTQAIGGWEERQEVWSRAIYMIQDFPYTGIGMGSFGQVANVMYPFFLAGPDADIPHAHNLFLQVAVDLGLPGLIAHVALLTGCFCMAARIYKSQISKSRIADHKSKICNPQSLAAGLLGSLTALVVHGLMDAATWGTKPAVMVWAVFGVTVALYRLDGDKGAGEPRRQGDKEHSRASPCHPLSPSPCPGKRLRTSASLLKNLLTFAYWILFSLLAIAFIGNRPYVGLAVALAGGVILGVCSVVPLEPRRRESK